MTGRPPEAADPGDPARQSRPDPDRSLAYEPPPDGRVDDDLPTPPPATPPPATPPGAGGPVGYGPPPAGSPPYGRPPEPPPYGAAAPPGYGPGYGPGYVGQPVPTPNAAAIALLIVSVLALLSCYFSLAALPALIIALVAVGRWRQDPVGSARLINVGWIVFGAVVALILLFMVGFGVLAFAG